MPLETEIRRYEELREDLERRSMGKFVVIHGNDLLGVFDDFNSANEEAEQQLNGTAFLIRQVGMSDLDRLTDRITSDNRHGEVSWGKSVGREVW